MFLQVLTRTSNKRGLPHSNFAPKRPQIISNCASHYHIIIYVTIWRTFCEITPSPVTETHMIYTHNSKTAWHKSGGTVGTM
eukprot:388368-Amphidinium_carterae.1